MRTVGKFYKHPIAKAASLPLVLLVFGARPVLGQTADDASAPQPAIVPDSAETTHSDTETMPNSQTGTAEAGAEARADESRDAPHPAEETASGDDALKRRLAAMEQEMTAMKANYDARLEELELNAVEDISESAAERWFRIYGFTDLSFMWRHIKDNALFEEGDGVVNTSPQFLMQHLNLYFSSQMTRTLSFLTEVQLTFLPNGGMTTSFSDPVKQNTTVTDPYTQQVYQWGSIMVQRAWLKWEPFQYLGVKAGYFLTPYGIWHEDHASTVRLSILPPFENDTVTPASFAPKKPIPDRQLGLEIYGRAFAGDHVHFDYAFTVSNGRGPSDAVVDYDDNKGLGLRLKMTYSSTDVEVALGGYGYFGEYTDKYVAFQDERLLENYTEYSAAVDFMITFFGVRLQAEYLRSLTRYSDEGRPTHFFDGGRGTYFAPDSVTSWFYTLLAYQLPLDSLLNGMTLTPYAGFEYDIPKDEVDDWRIWVVNFGLNFKPSSFVALKVEGSRMHLDWMQDNAAVWTVAGQAAVSF